jgi:hypothetical protein
MSNWRALAQVRQHIIRILEKRIDRLESELKRCTCQNGRRP